MTTEKRPDRGLPREKRVGRLPESGWELGAGGLTRASWATLAILLAALAAILLLAGYIGYGAMILILAGAAAVNLA